MRYRTTCWYYCLCPSWDCAVMKKARRSGPLTLYVKVPNLFLVAVRLTCGFHSR